MSDAISRLQTNTVISRRQLSDEAADYVRELIVSGQAKPGSRVRPEVIAAELGVSSTPAREGLQALRAEGFLWLEPRKGFTVAPLVGDDIRDVFTAQSLLAGELAARAALRANSDDMERLEVIQREIIEADVRADPAGIESLNHAFHREVHLLAGAPKIATVLRILSKYAPRRFYASVEGWQEATIHDHANLLSAIRLHDADAARAAMTSHVVHAGELLATHFDHRVRATDPDAITTGGVLA